MASRSVRADKIAAPGMINGQVIAHVLRSKIVIADLSFHNPNVFYELAIRHMTGLPAVHIVRKEDIIPFDLQNFRTVTIDTADKYESYRTNGEPRLGDRESRPPGLGERSRAIEPDPCVQSQAESYI